MEVNTVKSAKNLLNSPATRAILAVSGGLLLVIGIVAAIFFNFADFSLTVISLGIFSTLLSLLSFVRQSLWHISAMRNRADKTSVQVQALLDRKQIDPLTANQTQTIVESVLDSHPVKGNSSQVNSQLGRFESDFAQYLVSSNVNTQTVELLRQAVEMSDGKKLVVCSQNTRDFLSPLCQSIDVELDFASYDDDQQKIIWDIGKYQFVGIILDPSIKTNAKDILPLAWINSSVRLFVAGSRKQIFKLIPEITKGSQVSLKLENSSNYVKQYSILKAVS